MGAVAKYGTTFVVLINTLFGLVGLVFLVAGCFVKFGADKLDELLKPLLKAAASKIPDDMGIDTEVLNRCIAEFIGDAAIAFIIVGSVLLGLVIWAYCGVCCQSRFMLIIYAGLMTVIIAGEVALVVIVTKNRSMIDEPVKQPLKESITKFYQGSRGQNAVTIGWNAIMGLLNCCGVDGASDFNKTASWDHKVPVTSTVLPLIDAPILCCKDKDTVPTCGSPAEYKDGCYSAIWGVIEEHQSIAIGVAAGVGGLQVLLWILTVCIIKDMSKKSSKVRPQ